MLLQNEHYEETMSKSEIAFLRKKAKKDAAVYNKLFLIMVACAAFFSYFGAWENIEEKGIVIETIFSWENYFITLGILILVFFIALRFSRSTELGKILKDLRQKSKTIERVIIERKTYIPHNNTYHFYLNSILKKSVEVSAQDFDLFAEGDEISIEYSKNARVYFGYF